MSHVLLGGDDLKCAEWRHRLGGWGVSSGLLPGPAHLSDRPTVLDCDAVVFFIHEHDDGDGASRGITCLGAVPDGAGEAVAAAPLLLVGDDVLTVTLADGETWAVVQDHGPQERAIREVLESCFGRAREERLRATGSAPERDLYFKVGHELRTPLTAIKTAVEALSHDAEQDPGSLGPAAPRMFAVARRNMDRLEGAISWTQDLLACFVPPGDLAPAGEEETRTAESSPAAVAP